MSNFDRNYASPFIRGVGATADRAAAYDMGLRAHMIGVYNYMTGGIALTGVVAWLTYQLSVAATASGALALTPLGKALFTPPLVYVVMLAPLAVMFVDFQSIRLSTARLVYFGFTALIGLSLATIFMVFTATSITRVFFITAASFGALSLYGYTTKRSLDGLGSFLMIGVVGLVIASLVNLFLASSMMSWVISVVGVGIFAGLTAWHTQDIKELYSPADGEEVAGRKAVIGAFSLYLDFINMFRLLLNLVGDRRSE
jgi:FtsH-binding integral membrane protein